MKTPKLIAALAISFASAFIPSANADLFNVTDVNPDPNIFECDITSVEKDVTINGATVHAFAFKDENAPVPPASAGLPIQVIRAKVGDLIICRYKNQLSTESASIHWHGIELDNDSDGTPISQDAVKPGQSYTYKFQTFRPGLFWFHSHMLAGNTLFGGMYGVVIIENPIEASLKASGVLPGDADTHTLAMSDIEFDGTGKVGKNLGGVTKTENELIELCHLWGIGDPGGNNAACNLSQTPGSTVLVNGVNPDSGAQTPKFVVPSGKRIRLHLLNESISRHFKLKLLNSGDNKLYRIGGQGGLLDNVIVEGGTKGTWDTHYDAGEILVGPGMRSDVIIYPTGADGTIIQLVGNPVSGPFSISAALPANYPIAYFQISGTASDPAPAAGQPILAGTPEQIENIKSASVTPLVDPAPFGGSSDETIRLTTDSAPTGPGSFTNHQPSVDHYAAVLDSNAGDGDWLLVPHPPNARYAHVGDVLELTVRNESGNDHPFHLHGFSMQPVRMIDNATSNTLYDFDYNEFVDTVDVYGGQSYVFRTRIADRPKICDESPGVPPNTGPVLAPCADSPCGGVVGRWLFHCHIAGHAALGMIGEIDILPGVDSPPQIMCPANITQNTDPGLCSAVVNFSVTATDDCGTPTVVSVPPSGTTFPKGTTTVNATATDSSGQSNSCSFTVTVIDNEAPHITCPANIILDATSAAGAVVSFAATATDNCPPPPVITYSQNPGTTFAIGTNTVTSTATDSSLNMSSCQFTVTVRGPRAIEVDVLAQLQTLRATLTDNDQLHKLDDATGKLTDANSPGYWIDDSHPQLKQGDHVFDGKKDGVQKLGELAKQNPALAPVLQMAIAREVLAAKILVQVALPAASGNDLQEALKEFARGNASTDPHDAIDHYKNAWKHALHL